MKETGKLHKKSSFFRMAGVLCTVLLVGCALSVQGCKKKEKAAAPLMTPVVETVTVHQQDVPVKREWVGVLDGSVNATIRPQVSGYLIGRNYIEGEVVKKGQMLFGIDPRPFQTALNQAEAQLSQQKARHATARANLARIRPLAAKNAVSQKDLDDAVGTELTAAAAVEQAQAAVEQARLNLSFTRIVSPVDGVAGIAKAQLGDLVGPSMTTELATVSTLDPIKVYINVSEQEYLRAANAAGRSIEELPLELVLADGSFYPQTGHFSVLDRQVDPTTGTIRVGALFPNKDNILRPGQYGRLRATIRVRQGALLVPQRAVTEIQGRYLLAVVGADNKVDIRPVQVGERVGSEWIIESGIRPGEQVVVEGTQKVRPGMTVTVKPFAQAAAGPQAAGKRN